MSHFFAIKALPWLLPHQQRHPHWSNSSRWQEVIGSCRWAKTLLLARRLISFRCVIVCYYLANPYFLCACYAGQNKWKIQFTVKSPLPKKIIRGPLRMDTQVLLHCGIYLSEWFGFLCTRDLLCEVSGFGHDCLVTLSCCWKQNSFPKQVHLYMFY